MHVLCFSIWDDEREVLGRGDGASRSDEGPKGQPQEGGSSPSGDCRTPRLAPGIGQSTVARKTGHPCELD